jgi:peptidyl-prolyl cis-trans isomerase C
VVASQGGVQVSLQDIDAYAQKIPEADRAGFFDSPKRIKDVIMDLLLSKQLAAEARKAKLESDPSVKKQIEQAADGVLAHVDVEHYKHTLKLPDFTVLAQEYYQTHKDEFIVHGAISVKHVLVASKGRSATEAQSRIDEVETAARAHPDQFDALVEKYSDDPSKKNNHGLIEDAGSKRMSAPFAQAATALKKPGEISPVTKTEFGFHLLQLVDRQPDKQSSFEEVRAGLITKLRADYIEKETANHVGQMRGNPLDANPDLVASLRERFLPPSVVLPEDAEAANAAAAARKAADDKNATPAH